MKALLEPIDGGYFATAPAPWNERQRGATKEEALQKLVQALQERVAGGTVEVEIGTDTIPGGASHLLAEFAGDMKNNPLFGDWVAEMQKYRAEREDELATEV